MWKLLIHDDKEEDVCRYPISLWILFHATIPIIVCLCFGIYFVRLYMEMFEDPDQTSIHTRIIMMSLTIVNDVLNGIISFIGVTLLMAEDQCNDFHEFKSFQFAVILLIADPVKNIVLGLLEEISKNLGCVDDS